jgi:hypothetical protein
MFIFTSLVFFFKMEKWLALLHSVICRKCLISGSLLCILLSFELYCVQIKIITKYGGLILSDARPA